MTHELIVKISPSFKIKPMKILIALLTLTSLSALAGRPDQAFSFTEATCVCRNALPVSKGDCANVCRGKNTNGTDTLFATFSVGTVLGNSSLKNVKNWCYKYLLGDSGFPKCVLEAIDDSGKKSYISQFSFSKDNALSADVTSLPNDMNYWFRLVETTSGAQSIPYEVSIFDPVGYPLKQRAASQYSCITLSSNTKSHFYFNPVTPPSPVLAGTDLACHDIAQYGERDNEMFPRLETITNAVPLWNQNNYLFYDNNGDGVLDVNELFMKKVKDNGGVTKGAIRLFGVLSSAGTRDANVAAGNDSYSRLGFAMSYWVDKNTFNSFCPNETHYASGKPQFKAVKEILGTSTEGIYIADRSENSVKDYLFVREADLKSVWFYMKNGVATKPTEDIVQFQTIYFYHPFNKENPYVKGPNQKIFRVRSAQELTGDLTTLQAFMSETGEMISYPSHDRKIACIPKLSR